MRADYERYSSAVKRDADGNPLNGLSIDNFQLKDEKNMGVHLQGWPNVPIRMASISVSEKYMVSQSP